MTPLSPEELLPCYENEQKNRLKFGNSIAIYRPVFPFKLTYLPFFKQMALQLTELIKQSTGRDFVNYFTFSLLKEGPKRKVEPFKYPYVYENSDKVYLKDADCCYGRLLKMHKDGYAYGDLTIENKIGFNYSVDMWFRWKSNLPGYEYIEPEDELDLKAEDITFEICDKVPDDFVRHYFGKPEKFDFNVWKELINDEECYPKKRSGKKKKNFPYEISESCAYPDVIFSVFLTEEVTESIQEEIVSELCSFQGEWDASHDTGIHFMDIMEEDEEDDNKVIKIAADFGDNDPEIIDSLIDCLRRSKLNIEKVVIQ